MDVKKYTFFLLGLNYFEGVAESDIALWFYQGKCSYSSYEKGDIIHLQSDNCKSIEILFSGMVSIQKIDDNGNILTIGNFTKTDVIGANLLFSTKAVYPMTSTCQKSCILISLKKELILELCRTNNNFLVSFLSLLSDKTLFVTDILHYLAHKSIREMITGYLKSEYIKQKSNVILLTTTKQELAEKFGVQRPSLSRELKKMRNDQLIEYDAKSITICDLNIVKAH